MDDVAQQAEMFGALVRTIITLTALVAVLRYVVVPSVIEWHRERARARRAGGPLQLDDEPPGPHVTRHGAS